ncbi:MAG: TM0106 family RecB-like putative nuclease [Acidimicrobiales bacterium]
MFLLDDTWVASATDLVVALRCEYQLLARRAEKAGVAERLVVEEDELLKRAADLGIDHERAELAKLAEAHGEGAPGGVVRIDQPSTKDRAQLEEAHRRTVEAMEGGAQVVYQAAFFDGRFHGLADFVVRVDDGTGPVRYEPADTKFARHARVEALLQLASYAFQIEQMGFPAPREVHLWLGDGTKTHHRFADLRPILLDRTGRLRALLDAPPGLPEWGTPDLRWCGRCDHCKAAAEARRDVLLVAGMRVDQRVKLVDAGIATIEQLAEADPAAPPAGIREGTFAKLQDQAALQVAQEASVDAAHPDGVVRAEVIAPDALALIPEPSPGDVFFDFEGDPLHQEDGEADLGLEYLWGLLTHDPAGGPGATTFEPLWAHDRVAEQRALEQFIDWLEARRRTPGFEGLHVYHYAAYEVTALKRLVQRYGTRADELDALLKDGVFVDLYGIVRRSVRVSQRSYSIKKLEPLYMGDELRESDVTGGAESVVAYAEWRQLLAKGEEEAAAAKLASLAEYNEYDCLSTLRLRDWLLARPGAARPGHVAAPVTEPDEPTPASILAAELREQVADVPRADRTPAQQATAMVGAALEYHRRESLPFWWDHFRRLAAPVEDWEHDGQMIVLAGAEPTVVADWHKPQRRWRRTYEAVVDLPGSFKLRLDREHHAIWDQPLPSHATTSSTADRGYAKGITIEAIEPEGELSRVRITEQLPAKCTEIEPEHRAFPAAISVGDAVDGRSKARAILGLAHAHRAQLEHGERPLPPGLQLLARARPRLVDGGALPPAEGDRVADAIVDAVRRLDRSYLAVQGPPGTGKSTTGADVIARLVDDGWKVGVVAQSHKTIEALLDKVVVAGVDPTLVLKRGDSAGPFLGTEATDAELHDAATAAEGEGVLIGGTAWDMVNDNRVPAGSLDLLVIDEAGQFSLADALAVSVAAPRLLLLGDPQQLPQVSQAVHPEPVDRAALAWVAADHATLPAELGYFLGRTYRMRPELCEVVSRLSYEGRLAADPCTEARHLEGVVPGIRTILVGHDGNRAASSQEATEVVRLVEELLGRTWTDPHERGGAARAGRPLEPADIIVVAPFNAQVNRIRERLDGAGHPEVPVGTVDKFQGREAPVAIVSMAASSAASSARGAGFLLSRHRLNVAISRAQHTAYLLHAPQLTDLVPGSPHTLESLGAFLGVSHHGRTSG